MAKHHAPRHVSLFHSVYAVFCHDSCSIFSSPPFLFSWRDGSLGPVLPFFFYGSMQAFQKERQILPQVSHIVHAFFVLQDVIRCLTVCHVPIRRAGDEHLMVQKEVIHGIHSLKSSPRRTAATAAPALWRMMEGFVSHTTAARSRTACMDEEMFAA